MVDTNASKSRSTILWLGAFFVLALALRVAFGMGVGFDEESGRQIFTGNDPYYHDRALRELVQGNGNLAYDHALNYPEGRSNPNPPLFVWSAYPLAMALDASGADDPTGTALNWMTGLWGALTVLPVFLIARDLWGRGAGLWAAFFTAISAPHIQRSVWGYADHDAITMVLITFAFACMVKAFKAAKPREYVASWTDLSAIAAGKKAAFLENRRAFAYAAGAGLFLTATALVWKGYPYALAVLAVGLGLQLLADHLRNRDSTLTFLLYLTPLVLVVVLPYLLYYWMYPEFLAGTVLPSLYVLIGVLVVGLILVPTRKMPSLVVFPGLLVAALLGLAVLLWVFPSAGYQVFSGLGYFNQSKLYTTIAEAQRAQLGFVAASFGFFTFLLAFWGFGKAVKGAWKGNEALTLMAAWSVVAFFMAFAASRFIMNAVPVFAILIGVAMVSLLARLGLGEVARRFRAMRGQNMGARLVKSLSWKPALGVLLVAVFLVLPNVWIGVDAALPAEYERERGLSSHFFGAFGISFDLKENGWLPTMAYLAQQDTHLKLEDRPAVIAWWDYGHWNVALGEHPTVADPFQSHFELAGRFLASESEEEAMGWLVILLANGDHLKAGAYSPAVAAALDGASPGLAADLGNAKGYDAQYRALSSHVNGTAVVALYNDVTAATGKSVGYMAVDIRMFPFGARNSGIFYAPVFLANKNPDDFLSTQIRSGSTTLTVQQYGVDADGNSYRLSEPRYVDSAGTTWVAYQGYAYRPGQTPLNGFSADSGIPLFQGNEQLVPTQKFANAMYTRAFGSYDASQPAGSGLNHWRVVQQTEKAGYFGPGQPDARLTALLQYYTGITVNGRLVDESGSPLSGLQVAFVDGYGGAHGVTVTDAEGRYSSIAPFSQNGDVRLAILGGGVQVFNVTDAELQFTHAEAMAGGSRAFRDITVPSATLSGVAYENTDGVAGFNATADKPLSGATVTVAGRTTTTGADGRYTLAGLPVGQHTATFSANGYNNATQTVTARSGETVTADAALTVRQSTVTLRFLDGGEPVGQVPMGITGAATRTVTTNSLGNATASLGPGAYQVKVDYNVTVNGVEQRYQGMADFTVPVGGAPMTVVVNRQ
jgi:dolichyl-phosphooligosaccharide-protein glycotransferase